MPLRVWRLAEQTEDLKIQAEIFRACCCCFGKIRGEVFSVGGGMSMPVSFCSSWNIGIVFHCPQPYASSQFLSFFPAAMGTPIGHRSHDTNAMGLSEFSTTWYILTVLVGVQGGQQWLQSVSPAVHDGMRGLIPACNPDIPAVEGFRTTWLPIWKGQKETQIVSCLHRALCRLQLFEEFFKKVF